MPCTGTTSSSCAARPMTRTWTLPRVPPPGQALYLPAWLPAQPGRAHQRRRAHADRRVRRTLRSEPRRVLRAVGGGTERRRSMARAGGGPGADVRHHGRPAAVLGAMELHRQQPQRPAHRRRLEPGGPVHLLARPADRSRRARLRRPRRRRLLPALRTARARQHRTDALGGRRRRLLLVVCRGRRDQVAHRDPCPRPAGRQPGSERLRRRGGLDLRFPQAAAARVWRANPDRCGWSCAHRGGSAAPQAGGRRGHE